MTDGGASRDTPWTRLFVDLREDDDFKGVTIHFTRSVAARRIGDRVEFGHVWDADSYILPCPPPKTLFATTLAAARTLDPDALPDDDVGRALVERRETVHPMIAALCAWASTPSSPVPDRVRDDVRAVSPAPPAIRIHAAVDITAKLMGA